MKIIVMNISQSLHAGIHDCASIPPECGISLSNHFIVTEQPQSCSGIMESRLSAFAE